MADGMDGLKSPFGTIRPEQWNVVDPSMFARGKQPVLLLEVEMITVMITVMMED